MPHTVWLPPYLWEHGSVVVDSEGEVVVDEVLARHSQVERVPVLKLFAGELRGRGEGGRGRERGVSAEAER